jgi:hypothetical protein
MPRQAKPNENKLLEMAIVGYQRKVESVKAGIADIKVQHRQPGPGRPKGTAAWIGPGTQTVLYGNCADAVCSGTRPSHAAKGYIRGMGEGY